MLRTTICRRASCGVRWSSHACSTALPPLRTWAEHRTCRGIGMMISGALRTSKRLKSSNTGKEEGVDKQTTALKNASATPPKATHGAAAASSRQATDSTKADVPSSSSFHAFRLRYGASGAKSHTRDRLPKADETGLVLCFSQGMTDYCWRDVSEETARTVRVPSVLHRETTANRIRLFGMPKGFPDTTADGFQSFFYLSQASAFVSNFASSIGFQSLLSGFFLGSSPQLWMLKDLIPALLAAYMANRVVSYENRPKFWFCVSVFMNNVTVISDMIIPSAIPNHLLPAAIVTSTVKQSASLMYFVTRAAALQHYAINNNLAELTKKFNSFGMVNYTVATALGIVYCTFIAHFTVQLVTVVVCCIVNMCLSSMSMTPITFRLLNFGTMYLLLRAYLLESGRIMTPQEVSDLLGVRMSPLLALKKVGIEENVATELIFVSPPVDKLQIRSDMLDEDVLYLSESRTFMLAMWKPSPIPLTLKECWQRWELPSLPYFIRERGWRRVDPRVAAMEKKFRKHRLCLLVQHKCTSKDLVTAYLIMYTAVLRHSDTEEELRAFIRKCHTEQALWHARGEAFRVQLEEANWDVKLPALDHHNFRMSELLVPPCMRRPKMQQSASASSVPPASSTSSSSATSEVSSTPSA